MGNHELPGGAPEPVCFLNPKDFQTGIGREIRNDLEPRLQHLSWEDFIRVAVYRWQDYLPEKLETVEKRPTAKELENLSWSSLVPEELKDPQKIAGWVGLAWEIWEAHLNGGGHLEPYLAVAGTMGTGKSSLVEALRGARPLGAAVFSEHWEDNSELTMFYSLLQSWADPACQQSKSFPEIVRILKEVQGRAQGYFAANKFALALMSLPLLPSVSVIQDTPLGQDNVYFETQVELGLASEENTQSYRRDVLLRKKLLPPYLQRPILVFAWAPFETVRERVLTVRGRSFESKVPRNYLETLHRNTLQWAIALSQVGVPVLIVDAKASDFRPGAIDRQPLAAKIWQEIDKIKT